MRSMGWLSGDGISGYGFEADRDRSACFDGSVSGVSEVVAALARLDGGDETADVSPSVVQDALLRGSHPMLELGEGLLDRIEVWLVRFRSSNHIDIINLVLRSALLRASPSGLI